MATTSKTLYRGAAATSTATLYTVPTTSTTTVVTNIAVTNTNTSGTGGTFTLALDGVSLHTQTPVDSNTTVYIDCKQVLEANSTPKIIEGSASATSINFHIAGVEIV